MKDFIMKLEILILRGNGRNRIIIFSTNNKIKNFLEKNKIEFTETKKTISFSLESHENPYFLINEMVKKLRKE